MKEKRKNLMDESLEKKLDERLEKNPNILVEFKRAKEELLEAVDDYYACIKLEETLDEITEEQIDKKLDSWGKCLNVILYYEKVESKVMDNLHEMKKFLTTLKAKKQEEIK